MKLSPEDKKLLERMAPGVFSREGFLGHDDRRPSEIIATDLAEIESLGVTQEQLAAKMQAVLDAAAGAFGAPVEIAGGAKAVFYEAMGRIPCPFGDGVQRKGEVVLIGPEGSEVRFTPLSIHLIAAHGFFQGLGSRYRIDPARIAHLLGMV